MLEISKEELKKLAQPRYEYQVLETDNASFQEKLNKKGKEGWKLVYCKWNDFVWDCVLEREQLGVLQEKVLEKLQKKESE